MSESHAFMEDLRELGSSRSLVSVSFGIHPTPALGAVFKFAFGDCHSETVLIPVQLFASLTRGCRDFLLDFRQDSDRDRAAIDLFKHHRPTLDAAEIAGLTREAMAIKIRFHADSAALGIEFWLYSGATMALLARPAIAAMLRDCVADAAMLAFSAPGVDVSPS